MLSRRVLLRNIGLGTALGAIPGLSFARADTDARLVLVILRGAADGLALVPPYGEGKWTIRQVVHHLADSHINAFVRMKLMLTEDNPTLKTYDQELWAETIESKCP